MKGQRFGLVLTWLAVWLVGGAAVSRAQATWAHAIGGGDYDTAVCIAPTSDGGSIAVGYSYSYGAGSSDMWAVKLDGMGGVQWQKTYGGAGSDLLYCVQQTSDGAYVVAGQAGYEPGNNPDCVVMKLDANGNVTREQWVYSWQNEKIYWIEQTSDGGFVVTGETSWDGGYGGTDLFVAKLDANLGVTWQKVFGSNGNDSGYCVKPAIGGGYVVVGNAGYEGLVLRLDGSGNTTWYRTYYLPVDGYDTLRLNSVYQKGDGTLAAVGQIYDLVHWDHEAVRVELDASGTLSLAAIYFGTGDDGLLSIQPASDGGAIMAGYTSSAGGGGLDMWVIKIGGGASWEKTYGGTSNEVGSIARSTSDGGYMVAGPTRTYGAGNDDLLVLKVDGSGSLDASCSLPATSSVTPTNVSLVGGMAASGKASSLGEWVFGFSGSPSQAANAAICSSGCPTITLNPTSLPDGLVGSAYSQAITATGGTIPYTYAVTAGALPAPLNLSGAGILSGSPGAAGTYSFTIAATDAYTCTGSRAYTMTIWSGCMPPQIATQPANQAISSGQSAALSVQATGSAPLSYQWYQGISGDKSRPVGTSSSSYNTGALTSTTNYWVYITNACGAASSSTATVTVSGRGPTIKSIKSRTSKPGSTAKISGSGFSADKTKNTVYFGKNKAVIKRARTTSLQVTIPSKCKKGNVSVYVVTNGAKSNAVTFQVK